MEIELKFRLTDASRKAVEEKLRAEGGKARQLVASYFDTPDRSLSEAGYSLRLRKEGRVWFQTLKSASSPSGVVRSEQNIRLGAVANPQLDLSRHFDTDDGRILERILSHSADNALLCRYTTDVRRLSVRIGRRTCIEYALDVGKISAQSDGNLPPLVLPVCELEIELVSGPVEGLLVAARKLIREHEAWIDVRSKAQRGDALASRSKTIAPDKSRAIKVNSSSLKVLVQNVLAECARQVLQNASQIASIEGGEPEHIHQLRVGLRRLRSAIKLFGAFVSDRVAALEPQAKLLAAGLGGNRDIDMMAESLWPRLRKVGAPLVELPLHESLRSPADLIRDADVQFWMLELLSLELLGSGETADGSWTQLMPIIRDWYSRCKKDAMRFERFDAGRRHRLRKRFKRLRYALEFIESELPPKRYRRFEKAVATALDALGQYNDLQVAMKSYRAIAETDSRAWFAVGWLQAQVTKAESRCVKALAFLKGMETPWRHTY